MGYIGKIPSAVPLTSADITDNVITSAKIVDGTITNTDIASSIITGQTAETSIAGGDQILIYDDSATALRKMTRTNFVAGIGGKVLQVVSTAKTDTFSSSTGSFIDVTGLSVSITPSSTSNKILIFSDIHYGTNANLGYAFFKLVRASTDIYLGDAAGSRIRGFGGGGSTDAATLTQLSTVFLDSPSTTSSTTYKIQIYNQNAASYAVYVNRTYNDTDNTSYSRAASSITVMEIAG